MAMLVMLPLLAAVGAFAWPRAGRWIGLAAMAGGLVLAGLLALLLLESGAHRHSVGGWAAPLGIELRADGLAAFFLAVTALVGVMVSVYANDYFGSPVTGPAGHGSRFFWPLWLLLFAGLNALFLSGDAFNLYVTLEIVGLSAVALVGLAGNRPATGAALRYLFVGLSGSLLYLMGVALLYGAHGTVDLALLGERMTSAPHALLALGLMAGGLLMKAALFPMHFWLPS
ncbi:MAG TPA: oxidoreductase, partial [Verrucomicrobiales bacterium]|nr:oxidoreductase [Verrucomicrobiales bacterium]